MFLQAGGGGKGIRPSLQQQQQQQPHHLPHTQQTQHQQQQQQPPPHQSSTTSTHQQQQQQHQSNRQSHHSHHPGPGLSQHHPGPGSQVSSTSLHLGHQSQQHRQHPPPHPHLTYQPQYSAYTPIHIQGNNNAAATAAALAQTVQMGGPSCGAPQVSGNVACSTAVGPATTAITVLGGGGGGGANTGGGGVHGSYGRNHGGAGAGGSGNMTHFAPNSALLQQPPPGAGTGFMTQPPPGTFLQPYHPHSQQSAVVLAAAAAAAAHFGNGPGNGPSGGANSNGSAVSQNAGGGGGASGAPLFTSHPPPLTHAHRHPHPQAVAAFYGHSASGPPPQRHLPHGHNPMRNVVGPHPRHQPAAAYMMPIFALPPGMPAHPQNGASPALTHVMGPQTATPTHLPPPTYVPQPMAMMPTGLPPQPIMPPPSTLHTYAPPIAPMNTHSGGVGSGGLYTKEHAMKKRRHAIPIIDPNDENILSGDTQRTSGSSPNAQEEASDKHPGQEETGSSSELQSRPGGPAVGVAVSVTVSPSLFAETRETDKTITPTSSHEPTLNAKTDQQMQTDAVARNLTDDEDTASIVTITAQDAIVELANTNDEPLSQHSIETLVDNMITGNAEHNKNDEMPIFEPEEDPLTENYIIEEYSDDDGDIYDIPFPTAVSVDLSLNEEILDANTTADVAMTIEIVGSDKAAEQNLGASRALDKVNIDEIVPFVPATTSTATARERDTYVPPHKMAHGATKAAGAYKEPLLQTPKYAVKQDTRGGKNVQKTVPHYGGNHLNYQNVKTQMQPPQQFPPYQSHYVYHPAPQHQQQHQQQHTQQQSHHQSQFQFSHAHMQKMYQQSSTSSSASSLSGFNASGSAAGQSGTPTSSSNSSTSGVSGAVAGGGGKSKKKRKTSKNTKERDKKLKQQAERDRTSGGVQPVLSHETGPTGGDVTTSLKNSTELLSGSVTNKITSPKGSARTTGSGTGNDENAAVMNAKPAPMTNLTNKYYPNANSNTKNDAKSSDTTVEEEKHQLEEAKTSTGKSPKKSNRHRKDSDKSSKTQRHKDSHAKADIEKKKQENQCEVSPASASEDAKSSEHNAPTNLDHLKGTRTQDIVERFLQPAMLASLSNSPKANGEDSQLQFLNSSSSACEEEEELLQKEMQARHASEVSTEDIRFGDFSEDNDEPLQTVALHVESATSQPQPQQHQEDEAVFRPPSSTGGKTKTPHATSPAKAQHTPKQTPSPSPAKSRKSSIESNASSRRGNRGRDAHHANQKGGGPKEKDRNQEKGKTKGKEAHSQQPEPVSKSSTEDKTGASGGPGHRYTLDVLKALAKSKESLKPPMVMNCHKGDCISQLFVPRPQNAGTAQQFSAPLQHQYQQMNFNESIEFLNKRRGGGGVGGNMSKRQQGGSGSGGGGSASGTALSAQAQRNMDYIRVHLSLKEEIKLSECVNAWQPEAIRSRLTNATAAGGSGAPAASQNDDIDVVLKKVRGVLNKLTPDNFDVLLKSMTSITMNTEEKMQQVMLLIFEKTVSEPNFAPTYAKFCKVLFQEVKTENKSLLSTLLIKRIQQEFETNVNNADAKRIKLQPLVDKLSSCTDAKERVELQAELDDQEYQFRRRAWGTVRFIGEMYKLQSITSERVLSCIELLLEHGSEEKLEYMCKLLTTVGHQLEQTVADNVTLHGRMDKTFKAIQQIVVRSQEASGGGGGGKKSHKHQQRTPKISSRVRFMMQDVIDLRSRFWDQPNLLNRGASSSQRGRNPSSRQDDKSRQNSSSSTTPASSSTPSMRPGGGGGGSYAGAAGGSANPLIRRQSSDLRETSGSRSGGGSGSYFLKKKEQQQHQQQTQLEQPKLNIDVNKLPFSRDEEHTKLGNPSMYMWRTASGKQSATVAKPEPSNPWTILGTMSASSQQKPNSGRSNNTATAAPSSAGAAKSTANQAETNNNKKKSEALEAKQLEKQLNEIEQQDDDVWYTMTSAECQKVLSRLIEEFQDDQGHNNNNTPDDACSDDTWKGRAMQIWRSLSSQQQISLLYNILMDYLHLAAVKSAQRKALATVFSYLLQHGDKLSISRKKFHIAYKRVGDEFADLLVDVPNGWMYVFEFLGPMIHENTLTFSDVWLAKWLDDCKFTERFLVAFITYFTRDFGVRYIRDLWSREHLERGQRFMKKETGSAKRWDNFIANNQFQYIYERNAKSKQKQNAKQLPQKAQPQRNTDEQLERIDYLIRTSSDCELAIDYVSTNVSVSEPFIRSLSTFLCCDLATVVVEPATISNNNNNNAQTDSCSTRTSINSDVEDGEDFSAKNNSASSSNTTATTTSSSTPQLNPQTFRQGAGLLRFCIDSNESFEMACLSGVIDTVQQRHEAGVAGELIRSTFTMLHESDVVSKATFDKWYRAYQRNELPAATGASQYRNDDDEQGYGAEDEFRAFMEDFLAN